MSNDPDRFWDLAAQFEVMARDLEECKNSNQRWELLKGMLVKIKDLEQIVYADQSLLDSKPNSTAPSNPPLSKAAHP
jgi:hypothetical protein